MNTIGWILILLGALMARQVYKGRVKEVGQDLSDAFIALASGDSDALGEVLTRTGDSATPTEADLSGYRLAGEGVAGALGGIAETVGKGLAAAAVARGEKAKGYRWAATGPDYYDCSGLMWRACQDLGYTGKRFTTASVPSLKDFKRVDTGAINDVVLWPAGSGGVTGHMGVVTGRNEFYSARSRKSGIGSASISSFRKTSPRYYRYVGAGSSTRQVGAGVGKALTDLASQMGNG